MNSFSSNFHFILKDLQPNVQSGSKKKKNKLDVAVQLDFVWQVSLSTLQNRIISWIDRISLLPRSNQHVRENGF